KISNEMKEMYESLESEIRKKFLINKEEVYPAYIMVGPSTKIGPQMGHEKDLTLPNGLFISSTSHASHQDILYINFISNENGSKEYHAEVIDFCKTFIDDNYSDTLCKREGESPFNFGLAVDGSGFRIDLSREKFDLKLSNSPFAGYLPTDIKMLVESTS
ncbi:hypothetical protein ACFL1H_04830, partial [Nanoarchaeota archaeon]